MIASERCLSVDRESERCIVVWRPRYATRTSASGMSLPLPLLLGALTGYSGYRSSAQHSIAMKCVSVMVMSCSMQSEQKNHEHSSTLLDMMT